MRAATPVLTDTYQWVAAAVLLAIQIPVALLLLRRLRGARDPRAVVAIGLLLGVAVANALLYAAGSGLQNVRYALPAAYVVAAAIAWGNLPWLASQPWLTDRVRRASRPAADGHA